MLFWVGSSQVGSFMFKIYLFSAVHINFSHLWATEFFAAAYDAIGEGLRDLKAIFL